VSDATTLDAGGSIPEERHARAYLVVREDDRTQVVTLDDGAQILIGRSPEATVRIDDAKASREHARIERRDGVLRVADLASRNGTHVNADVVRGQTRELRSGDLLHIGAVEILVAESGASAGDDAGARLEGELQRMRAAQDGRALLLRLSLNDAELATLATTLGRTALVEEHGEGEYACLLEDPGELDALRATITRQAPGAHVGVARAPEDGVTAAELWRRAAPPDPAVVVRVQAPPGVVIADPAMVRVFELVRKVAAAPTTVLILGETGVGKEVVAEQIHRQSPRANGPFVRLNCSSLPDTLLESELFGHEKGAFTGADRRKLGYIEAANGGTLFLDEIGELALPMQSKLLRVLEDHRFARVGGREEISADIRVVAATNRDLAADAKAGRFREDLFFRLSTFIITVPPLRDRPVEVELLAELFVRAFTRRMNADARSLSPQALALLRKHAWPGNVRELRNAMERAVVLADEGVIGPQHLPDGLGTGPSPQGPMREQIAEIEKRAIEEALAAEGGNQTRAAKRLGISRRALQYKLEKLRDKP
jgi:transcriptional regulator with AAA-type ATPase domain/pSer/pThr/pTyr-binding forkhead associated (FHA) protein